MNFSEFSRSIYAWPADFIATLVNSADPDQMPHHVASDQGLHCLLTGFSIKNRINVTK